MMRPAWDPLRFDIRSKLLLRQVGVPDRPGSDAALRDLSSAGIDPSPDASFPVRPAG